MTTRFILPTIGDGTGGTVVVGSVYLAVAANEGYTEILDVMLRKLVNMEPRIRKLFVALDTFQHWSYSDSPNQYSAEDIPDLPPGGEPGLHAITHEDGGNDEISVAALSGLLADSQAPLAHTHVIADTTGLQTVLDGKADDAHSHVIADVTGLQTALDGKANTAHTHAIADTTGLQTALDAKAALSHTHPESDVTSLVADLAGKSAVGHTHPASEVVSGVLAAVRIATGSPDGTKFLRDDQVWTLPTASAAPFLRHPDANVTIAADVTQHVVNEYEVKSNRTTELAALAALEIG